MQKGVADKQVDPQLSARSSSASALIWATWCQERRGPLRRRGQHRRPPNKPGRTGRRVISGTAYEHLQGKLECAFEYLGERALKNMQRPVRMYRVLPGVDRAAGPAHVVLPD